MKQKNLRKTGQTVIISTSECASHYRTTRNISKLKIIINHMINYHKLS